MTTLLIAAADGSIVLIEPPSPEKPELPEHLIPVGQVGSAIAAPFVKPAIVRPCESEAPRGPCLARCPAALSALVSERVAA